MKVLVASKDIEVLAAALGQHPAEDIWWWSEESRRKEGYALGLLRYRIVETPTREQAIDMGWDKVMKALPRSFTLKVDEEE
jgi:hypothetical protein